MTEPQPPDDATTRVLLGHPFLELDDPPSPVRDNPLDDAVMLRPDEPENEDTYPADVTVEQAARWTAARTEMTAAWQAYIDACEAAADTVNAARRRYHDATADLTPAYKTARREQERRDADAAEAEARAEAAAETIRAQIEGPRVLVIDALRKRRPTGLPGPYDNWTSFVVHHVDCNHRTGWDAKRPTEPVFESLDNLHVCVSCKAGQVLREWRPSAYAAYTARMDRLPRPLDRTRIAGIMSDFAPRSKFRKTGWEFLDHPSWLKELGLVKHEQAVIGYYDHDGARRAGPLPGLWLPMLSAKLRAAGYRTRISGPATKPENKKFEHPGLLLILGRMTRAEQRDDAPELKRLVAQGLLADPRKDAQTWLTGVIVASVPDTPEGLAL